MKPYGIALLGCGTVGTGVARLLTEHRERLETRAGRALALRRIIVRDVSRPRSGSISSTLFSSDLRSVLQDPEIDVAVEAVGGVTWALQAILDLLAAGKDVVTANKALLAECGTEIFDAARRHGRAIAFEASVGGGIPIVAVLAQGLAANQITSIQGILNGTCNFILTKMTDEGQSYADALKESHQRGYAEPDPKNDVDGTDTAQKLAILAQIAFGARVSINAIERRGIADIQEIDLRYAGELGYAIRLLAESWLHERQLALHVSPVLLRHQTPMAQVRGPYNAIQVIGDAVGDTLYYGAGAGQMPTASAVVADLIDMAVGRAQRTFETSRLWSNSSSDFTLRPADAVRSRFYLRVLATDRPGVLADIARELAVHEISISSVIQHEDEQEGHIVPLVIMTHTALTGRFRAAIDEIDRLHSIVAPSVYFPVAD
jgi:homoserine dehydrogenase